MAAHLQGQHRSQGVRLGVDFGADKPRPKIQVPSFERAKIPFHKGQILITIMDGLRVGLAGLEIGLDGVTAVQLGGSGEGFSLEG